MHGTFAQVDSGGWTNLFYRNRRLLVLALAVIAVGGLSAYQVLPRAEDPTLKERMARVLTRFPGASAERVEALITEKLEDALQEVEEIKTLTSTSRAGISVIQVELEDVVDEVDPVWVRVREKIDDAEPLLPADAGKPEFDELTVTAATRIVALTWERPDPPAYGILRRLAEGLEDELRGLAGTDEVELFGDPDEEIRVEVDAATLAARGLSPETVAERLAQADAKTPGGRMTQKRTDLLVEVAGEVKSLNRVAEIVIAENADGTLLRLGDVATIRKTIREPPSDLAIIDGKPAVVVMARIEDTVRVDEWAAAAEARVGRFAAGVPAGIGVSTIFDQSRYVAARLDNLQQNLLIAMGLVVIVILITMGWRASLAVGAALPLVSLMVLSGMRILDVPLHQMSVTGLIIALGLLIDNAIVVVDEVHQRRDRGLGPSRAIAEAVKHLRGPLFGSTFTTMLAFLPIVLMPGPAGEFVGTIGLSVILAIVSSFLLAMSVIPALAGLLLRSSSETSEAGPSWAEGVQLPGVARAYRRTLDFVLARPVLGILLGMILPAIGFWQASSLPEQFFPPTSRDQFQLELRLGTEASLENTLAAMQALDPVFADEPLVTGVHWFAGTSAPRYYYNMVGGQDDSAFYAQALVQTKAEIDTAGLLRRLQPQLDAALPRGMLIARQFEQGPPVDAPVELRLYGPDLDVLRELGNALRREMAALPDVTHTYATLSDGLPKLWVALREEEARRAGLDNVAVARQLQSNLTGVTGGSMLESTEELPVRVRLKPGSRADVGDLASVNLIGGRADANGDRAFLPLAAIGEVELRPERASIPHRDGERVNSVQAFVRAGTLAGDTLAALKSRLAAEGFEPPPGYRLEIGGESAERDRAVANLMASVSVLAVVMVATLVLSFQSFRLAALLMTVAGLASGLGLWAIWLFGYPFGFMAIVGTMGLIGVALNDAIVVLAAIREDPGAARGDRAALREVVVRASRHVISTTLTTIAGFMPLLLSGGAFWPPLAIAIAGGVVGATLLALYLAPCGYVLLKAPRTRKAEALMPEPIAMNAV